MKNCFYNVFMNFRSCDLSGNTSNLDGVLSPLDEDSSVSSEHNISSQMAKPEMSLEVNKSIEETEGKPENYFQKHQ